MRDDSYLFPNRTILKEVLKGEFGRSILYDGPLDDLDDTNEEDQVDCRVSYSWANKELLTVVKNWEEDGRKFGTQTGLFILLAGQESHSPEGSKTWQEVDLHAGVRCFGCAKRLSKDVTRVKSNSYESL